MTDPIELTIETLKSYIRDSDDYPHQLRELAEALAALRSIKPPCQMCWHYWPKRDGMEAYCGSLNCTNFDKFTPLEPVCLTKEKS